MANFGDAAYEILASGSLSSSSSSTISITSIPQTHKHLQLKGNFWASSSTSTYFSGYIRPNGHSGYQSDYFNSYLGGTGYYGTYSSLSYNHTGAYFDVGGYASPLDVTILDYTNTNRNKVIVSRTNNNRSGISWPSGPLTALRSSLYRRNDAITQIDLNFAGYTVAAGGQWMLLGVVG